LQGKASNCFARIWFSHVEGGNVRITNDKGIMLDEFIAPGWDFSNGRIAVPSDFLFLVRGDN
jgi:hypothetical protein